MIIEDKVSKPSNFSCILLPVKYLKKTDRRTDDETTVVLSRQIEKKLQTAKPFLVEFYVRLHSHYSILYGVSGDRQLFYALDNCNFAPKIVVTAPPLKYFYLAST